MKKSVIVAALIAASANAFANEAGTFIVSSNDGEEAWVFYETTYIRHTDGYSVMYGKRSLRNRANEERGYLGTDFDTCKRRFGSLSVRKTLNDNWSVVTNVSFSNGTNTVGDEIAKALCDRAAALTAKGKKTKM